MDMSGEERIAAPQDAVYAALNDPDILRQCIPGCISLEKTSDTVLTATVGLSVGPVKATFKGGVTLSDLDPPRGYTITGEGKGGPAGHARGSAKVDLVGEGDITRLRYQVHADIGGKLAQLGGRLIDTTARKLAGEFFVRFGTVVGQAETAPAAAAVPASPGSPPSAAVASSLSARLVAVAAGAAVLVILAVVLLNR